MLDVPDLRLVKAIDEAGTLTGAAERLFRSQSALSQRLQSAEERLGAKLFERGGRAMTLTPVGERILEAARSVLDEIERAESDARGISEGRIGTLRLATQCYACYHWLPPLLRAYQAEFPKVDVHIVAEATSDPTSALLNRTLDVALVTANESREKALQTRALFDDEMVALVHRGHPWAGRAFVRAEDFSDEHVIVCKAPAEESLLYQKVLAPQGVSPRRVTTMPLATSAGVELARAEMGVAIIERWAAAPFLDAESSLTAVQITEEGLWQTWQAATRRGERMPYYQRCFLERLAEVERAHFGSMQPHPPAGTPAG